MANTTLKSTSVWSMANMRSLILLFVFFALGGNAFAATYYSKLTGNANQTATWGTNPDGTGTAPANFTTSGDIFIVPAAATLNLNGNWTIGANVTVQMDGAIAITSNNRDISVAGTIEFNNASQTQISSSGNGFDFTLTGTLITANVNGVTGVTNASVIPSGNGSFNYGGSAIVTFDGANQVANGVTASINTLNVNSTRLTLAAQLFANNVNLNSGLIVLGPHNLGTSNFNVTSPSVSKMVVASGAGELRINVTGISGSVLFPIGEDTGIVEYSPVQLSWGGGGTANTLGARVVDAKHPNNNSVGNFITRYWSVTRLGSSTTTFTATGYYTPADVVGTESGIAAARLIGTFNLTSNPWVKGSIADGDVTVTAPNAAATTTMVVTGIAAQQPVVTISGGNVTVCAGTDVPLTTTATADSALTYSWNPPSFLSSTTTANTIVQAPTASNLYTVTVRDANGIGDTDNTTITVLQNVTYYADADGDTFGDINAPMVSCTGAPEGYVLNNTDCDDDNAAINSQYSFYVDSDNDGFGTGSLVLVCAVNAATPPVGYSLNNTDCDDNDNAVNTTFPFYTDADNDGYGAGALVQACAVDGATPPVGYSLNNSDCDDFNPAAFALFSFYVDLDGDGYGIGEPVEVCSSAANVAPVGYAVANGDCNDSAFSINPGKTEILYNGIDDNCNGTIDDNNQILSQVIPEQCGGTLASISSLISAVSFNNSTGYRFEVTNLTTNQVYVLDRPLRNFSLTMLPAFDYATTYSIRVEVQRNGVWLGYYGPACLVSSPLVTGVGGTATIVPEQCGATLATINTLIASQSVPNTTKYRFRITNISDPSAPNQVQVIDRDLRWFALTMLPTYNYGTIYLIEVAVKATGEFTGYGTPCIVSTPDVPKLTDNFCGAVIPTAGTLITTLNRSNTTSYRFEIINLNTNIAVTLNRPGHWFSFNMIPGYAPNTEYGVRVALMTSGSYSPYGEVCVITSPGAAREIDTKDETSIAEFDATAYPNPFAGSFNLAVNQIDTEASVKVYDMTGRLLETLKFNPANGDAVIGEKYPSGVYTVIVEQGGQAETLRVIKR